MADDQEDGEKLFSAENKELKSPEAVKFIPESENKNGISPISVDHVKNVFTGLTKEELMKYANDPFWVRIRWFLFVMFWLIWLTMLFGAVFIIVITPKCKEPSPLTWWQRSPLYVIDIKDIASDNSSTESSVIGILKNRLNYLKNELDIGTVLLKSVLESKKENYDEVMNFTNVNYRLESLNVFHTSIINFAKSKGIKIMLGFSPNYSGKNNDFARSVVKESGYEDYYVWYSPTNSTVEPDKPPNNWLSVYNTSAWKWDEERMQFYLHQFKETQPDFNFRNPAVVDFISDVLRFWLRNYVNGIYLDKTEYLLEDAKFLDEEIGRDTKYGLTEYNFYMHTRTYELPENINLLDKWSQVIKNESGIMSVSGGVLDEKEIANFVLRPISLSPNFNATELMSKISYWKEAVVTPTWEWKCSNLYIKCWPDSLWNGFAIISYLLPGVPVLHDGDKILESTNATHTEKKLENSTQIESHQEESNIDLLRRLKEIRENSAFSFGTFEHMVANGSVYAFTRIKAGSPGYLVAWNVANETQIVNFPEVFPIIPGDLIVVMKSSHSFEKTYEIKNKVSSIRVEIPPEAAVVFSFVSAK